MLRRFEGERRLIETKVSQERTEEAEEQAREVFENCQEAGMQVRLNYVGADVCRSGIEGCQ